MTHSLVCQAVNIKTTIFDPPSRLVNSNELCCAIAMAYKAAGLSKPPVEEGTEVKAFQEEALKILDSPNVKPSLKYVIENYIFSGAETVGNDAKVIMDLVYQRG